MAEQGGSEKKGTIYGGLGILGVLALKFKGVLLALLKFGWLGKSFISMFVSIGIYAMFWGWPYAVAIVLLLLIHEFGHWIWMQALGLKPQLPMFVPGVGAYVAMTHLPPDATTRAWVAFAGPLIGGIGSAALYWAGAHLSNGWLMAAGSTGFFLNLLQLVPAKPLDGGFVVGAISKWLLLPGSLMLLWLAYNLHSVLLLIIGVIAVFSCIHTLFGKGRTSTLEGELIPASLPQKIIVGIAYLGLSGMLAYLYILSTTTVVDLMHTHGH